MSVSRAGGEQLERVDVGRAYDAEVASVHRGDRREPETFGDCNDRSVDHTEAEVQVGVDQFDTAFPVDGGEIDWVEHTCRDQAEEACFGSRSVAVLKEPRSLGHDRHGCGELVGVLAKHGCAALVVGIMFVVNGDLDIRVDEQRHR